eukprot:CAMPEP_0179106938 /NCGR_PEP_ID=MMETSP0796-20121207/49749_1 /TAXON_ID=73915 /ORGANISM="Pyrodinium bahamense, Strain pbaha01" /LENGTH=127 /DNA_ID=CAMNT_0020804987 /DNA_START=112 /DNA_END=495 /DNA_ORIENTATION=+
MIRRWRSRLPLEGLGWLLRVCERWQNWQVAPLMQPTLEWINTHGLQLPDSWSAEPMVSMPSALLASSSARALGSLAMASLFVTFESSSPISSFRRQGALPDKFWLSLLARNSTFWSRIALASACSEL